MVRVAVILIAVVTMFSCTPAEPAQTAGAPAGCRNSLPLVTIHGVRGVVLPSAVARRDLSLRRKDVEDFWVPSEDDVAELEGGLHDALKGRLAGVTAEPPSPDRDAEIAALEHVLQHQAESLRQYAGIVVNGSRRVLVNAFPEDTYCYRDTLVVVDDGGPWFWRIQYDVKLGQFLHFEFERTRGARR
jgi:hypothetical protein